MGAAEPRVGSVVLDKYRLERELGRGGMGTVFSAVHVHLDQRVALKFLDRELAQFPELTERFLREARVAATLRGDHVARVLDIGRLEDGTYCMVMEYLEGEDLESAVARRGAFSIAEAVDYILAACEALAEAHAHGVVHRDVKPANLFLAVKPDGGTQLKVIDFGVAGFDLQITGEARDVTPLTRTRALVGTPHYMSPEQLTSPREVDARSDIWSLGATLFELLSGDRPFAGATVPEICAGILKEDPLRLDAPPHGLPKGIASVVARCLSKRREDRYPHVAELAAALQPFGPDDADRRVERIDAVLTRTGREPPMAKRLSHRIDPEAESVVRSVAPDEERTIKATTPIRDAALQDTAPPPPMKPVGYDPTALVRLAMKRGDLTSLPLDSTAAFLLSRIDGACTVEELLDAAGIGHDDALEALSKLIEARIVTMGPRGAE